LRDWHVTLCGARFANSNCCKNRGNLKESNMNRLITTTAVAVLLGLAPALAADTAAPTQPGATPEAAKSATQPDSGDADTSTGAKEQSSAPPSSGAATAGKTDMNVTGGDQSTGAKEQSSAPQGSSAADPSKPNPTIGSDGSEKSDTSKE
jgi:hypothetical protein